MFSTTQISKNNNSITAVSGGILLKNRSKMYGYIKNNIGNFN